MRAANGMRSLACKRSSKSSVCEGRTLRRLSPRRGYPVAYCVCRPAIREWVTRATGWCACLEEGTGHATMVAPVEQQTGKAKTSRSAPPKRILIADDDAATRGLLIEMLQGEGFDTLEAKSGSEVL